MSEKQKNSGNAYRLKTMVAVRVLAEATVMILLILMPVVLLALGKFTVLSVTAKLVIVTLSLLAACVLPLYGLITYKVTVSSDSLTTYCLWKRRTCRFDLLKSLTRRSNWNVLRYIVSFEGGECSFPIWLNNCEALVAVVRQHLPKGSIGLDTYADRTFKQDPVSLFFQVAQAFLSAIFIGVVWCFTAAVHHSGLHSLADIGLLIVFAVVISAVLLWRAYVVALMPSSVEVKAEHLVVHTFFFERNVLWSELKAIAEPYPLLPEGILIKTAKGSYLVGNGMDSADELEATLKARLAEREILN